MPFPLPDTFWSEGRAPEFWRKLSLSVRGILSGKVNNVHTITLTPSATETEFVDELIDSNTRAFLHPMTASAAASVASVYATTTAGKAVFHHDSSPAADRTFSFVHFG